MKDLCIIVPTRGRPDNIMALWSSFSETSDGSADLLIAVDDDDPFRHEYRDIATVSGFFYRQGSRLRLGGTLNETALEVAEIYPYVGFMGDDHRPRTQGWDGRYVDSLSRVHVVYGNDLLQGEFLPTQVALRSSIVLRLGYMCPPGLVHFYLDNFWLEVGNYLNSIEYLPDVVVEHMHHSVGKSSSDSGYADVEAFISADKELYRQYLEEHFYNDMKRLQHGS